MSIEQRNLGDIEPQFEPTNSETIESIGKRWAQTAMERGGWRSNTILLVRDTPEYNRIIKLPSITGEEERRRSNLRFDNVGNIYVPEWRVKHPSVDESGRKYFRTKDGYRVINRKRVDWTIDDLPKTSEFSELILSKVATGVESAIRMQRHILDEYSPETEAKEVELAHRVIAHTDQLAFRIMTVSSADNSRQLIARSIGEFLENDVHLVAPKDPNKRKILHNLSNVSLTDILGRNNPLVARTRIRAAYLAATKRLIIGGVIVRKFADNQQVLLYERETTRWSMKTASDHLKVVLYNEDFNLPDGDARKQQGAAIANMLIHISQGYLGIPKLKPYLLPSRYAAINLIGVRDFKEKENRKILEEEDGKAEVIDRIPVRMLASRGLLSETKGRIEESIEELDAVLEKYESIDKPST